MTKRTKPAPTASTTLPATWEAANLEDMVGSVVRNIDAMVAKVSLLTSEDSRRKLREGFHHAIRSGTVPLDRVIEAADAGHQDADIALREAAAELIDSGDFGSEASALLRAYAIKALLRPLVTYPQGHKLADTWFPDVAIAVLMDVAKRQFGLTVSRNKASENPSANYVVALALKRRRHVLGNRKPPGEDQIARIYREHEKMAARLSSAFEPKV